MGNRLDDAIIAYTRNRCHALFTTMYKVFMNENLYVPVSEAVKEPQPGSYDVPVICIRTETGVGAIPVFTTMEHLLKWKPQGCLYTTLTGRSLIAMAIGMDDISEIHVNPKDAPRGQIPRADFEKMLNLGE